jgi:D-3-phosphoglycerate dehydrogenase / 2-oxoglutarate reductase
MIFVHTMDPLSEEGLKAFNPNRYELTTVATQAEVILVRSHSLHGYDFPKNLKAVGRAGAGTDNIPLAQLTQLGIPVFNAPGANANAVKELVLAAMLIGYRHLDEARLFLKKLSKKRKSELNQEIEHQKKKFVGREIYGKTLGVIGLGNVGVKVANAAQALGMNVIGYDAGITVRNALALMPDIVTSNDMNWVLAHADIITLHVPLNAETTHLIHEKNINLLKEHALLLNFSREQVVDECAVLKQLNDKKILGYLTDFPTTLLANHPNVLSFPHLGASTLEAEQHSAEMVVRNICNYLDYGTIEYSVNFPNIAMGSASVPHCHRLMVINRNVPGAIGSITKTLSQMGYNIEQMVNASRDTIAVNLIDISGSTIPPNLETYFNAVPSFIKVFVVV